MFAKLLAVILSAITLSHSDCTKNGTLVIDNNRWVGQYNSLVLDSSGYAVISYYDATNEHIKLARCYDPTCTFDNMTITVIDSYYDGFLSLALYSNGYPAIIYDTFTNEGNHLKLAQCYDAACTLKNITSIGNSPSSSTSIVGTFVIDSNDFPVIVYSNWNTLSLIRCYDPSCITNERTMVVEDSDQDFLGSLSLALDSHGYPVISYQGHYEQYNANGQFLDLARCYNLNCTSRDIIVIDILDDKYETSPSTATSLALDSDDNPVVSYAGPNGLYLARCYDPICTSSKISLIDYTGLHGGITTSLALDIHGYPVMTFYSPYKDFALIRCYGTTCTVAPIDNTPSSGEYNSLALDPNGNPVISYYDQQDLDLKLYLCLSV